MSSSRFLTTAAAPLAVAVLALGGLLTTAVPAESQPADADRTAIAVEALSRLEGVDIHQNPALKNAVLKVVESTRGTPNYVKLVRQFKLADQAPGMLDYAVEHPKDEAGVAAMSWVLDSGDAGLLNGTLRGTNLVRAAGAAEALGNTGNTRMIPLLSPLLTLDTVDTSLRKQAVRSLTRTSEGARTVIETARRGALPDNLRLVAGMELAAVRWADIKEEAAEVLPPPQGGDARPLPPVSELLAMKGDPAKGAEVFAREGPNCATCHRVRGVGTDVGPDLSGIGTKLGRDALFDSILDPSAGISFGFEAFELELESGDEAFGLIVSETPEEVAVKDTRGLVTRHRKSDIVSRRQMKLSIMPTGLQMTMSAQELVDLVAYLASLQSP